MQSILVIQILLQWAIITAKDAFRVYWNVPSASCKELGIDIPLSDFGIIHNKGQEFFGNKVVIFYENRFGLCPYYKDYDPSKPINGGLPQVYKFSLSASSFEGIYTKVSSN
ncbi:hypothetical protein Y032_0487g2339 [Ancylostoma ceylanicum]|uniref:Hyaluronidase n=1 Tax=Ancylostoma ceylanicum TaxID=53326 RepID=A0A016WVC8_9BILA|nr:hypothetical protein Y032_0487g2339 [Ancylostoma ceylanicum]